MKLTSEQLRELCLKKFPFPTPNPGQIETIQEAVEQILAGTKFVILQAPTGAGKSVIATTVHRVIQAVNKGWRTGIITGTKGLQNQYVTDDPSIYDLKGRTNYSCPKGAQYYNHQDCRRKVALGQCIKHTTCPYIMRREKWCKEADLRLTNASFMIEAPHTLVSGDEFGTDLLVVDECHELAQKLIDHNKIKIGTKEFFYLEKAVGPNFMGIIADVINSYMSIPIGTAFRPNQEQIREVEGLEKFLGDTSEELESRLKDSSLDSKAKEIAGGALEEIQGLSESLGLYAHTDGEWILSEYTPAELLELTPVYASQVSWPGILTKAPQFLLMSATICGFDEFRKDLGIKDSYHIIDIPSPLPAKQRPVVIVPRVAVSGRGFDEKSWLTLIDSIIEKNGTNNGVIHTVSFALADKIKKGSKFGKRMIISNDRREILQALKKSKSGQIIVSPSVTTGYDFKGDLARWQIIAKCPFLFLGDPAVKLNSDRSPRWYSRECVLKLVQASGRVCRGVDDYGITFIIDSNIVRLLKYNSDLFPDWWLESVIIKE